MEFYYCLRQMNFIVLKSFQLHTCHCHPLQDLADDRIVSTGCGYDTLPAVVKSIDNGEAQYGPSRGMMDRGRPYMREDNLA